MAKRGKGKAKISEGFGPVAEQARDAKFEMAFMVEDGRRARAYVRKPVIDVLFDAGKLSELEYSNLAYYRDQALKAEDDYCEESVIAPAKIMGGGTGGHPIGGYVPNRLLFTPAIIETGRIERDLGSLLDIARAIAVADMTLSKWCIEKHGGRERYDGKGRFVAMVPISEKKHMAIAHMELRMAAKRICR